MADVAVPRADASTALKRAQQGKSYWRRVWERLREDKVTLTVMGVLVMLLVMVVFAPWFTVHDPYSGSVLRRLKPVGTPGHWLGTDEVGRDLWSRMVYGGRLSLLAGVVPVFLALLVGGFLGILAGYVGGLLNSAVMRLTDVLYAFPSILLAIAITGILGAGLKNTILALTISFIPPIIRISESVTMQVRISTSSRRPAQRARRLTIVRYHILNNVLGPILVFATSLISICIIQPPA
jgi:peptide/nickel transport system permease protein